MRKTFQHILPKKQEKKEGSLLYQISQFLLDQYEIMINLIKSINLAASAICFNFSKTSKLKKLLQIFYLSLKQYNKYLIFSNHHLIFPLYISPTAFAKKNMPVISVENNDFVINIIFSREKKRIRLHPQILKKGRFIQTNFILTRLQHMLMQDILDLCSLESFFDRHSFTLKNKKQKILYKQLSRFPKSQISQQTDYILPFLKKLIQAFLNFLEELFSTQIHCSYCKRYLTFNKNEKIMEPPTMKFFLSKKEGRQYFHESCFSYWKPKQKET